MTDERTTYVPLREFERRKAEASRKVDIYISKDGGPPPPDVERVIHELGEMTPAEYGRRRPEIAEKVGTSRSLLDAEYRERRKRAKEDCGDGRDFLSDPDPWPDPVDGNKLLGELVATAKEHLVLPNGAAETIALWVVFSHAHDCFYISPVLGITSPTPECGKTTLLTMLGALAPRPLPSSNVTAAVLFRAVDKWSPTLLIDEADTFLRDSDELRGILNSGHNRRNAYTIRTVGDNYEPKQFSTWSPKAIAMIGRMHPTLSSRSLRIELQRKTAAETVEPLREDRLSLLDPLQRRAARWAADNAAALRARDPQMPSMLHSRSADNWRPLIAVADLAGGEWPERARRVAEAFAASASDETKSIVLLGDIRGIFENRGADRLHSDDIVADLVAMEDRPWSEWGRSQKPITKVQLAALLKTFGVTPKQVWNGSKNKNGYALDTLANHFTRYLASRPLDPLETKELRADQNPRADESLEFETPRKPLDAKASRVLEGKNPQIGILRDGDPFEYLKDPSLKLQPKADDYPELPTFLDRRNVQ